MPKTTESPTTEDWKEYNCLPAEVRSRIAFYTGDDPVLKRLALAHQTKVETLEDVANKTLALFDHMKTVATDVPISTAIHVLPVARALAKWKALEK